MLVEWGNSLQEKLCLFANAKLETTFEHAKLSRLSMNWSYGGQEHIWLLLAGTVSVLATGSILPVCIVFESQIAVLYTRRRLSGTQWTGHAEDTIQLHHVLLMFYGRDGNGVEKKDKKSHWKQQVYDSPGTRPTVVANSQCDRKWCYSTYQKIWMCSRTHIDEISASSPWVLSSSCSLLKWRSHICDDDFYCISNVAGTAGYSKVMNATGESTSDRSCI